MLPHCPAPYRKKRHPILWIVIIAAIAVCSSCSTAPVTPGTEESSPAAKWEAGGIQVVRVRLAMDGMMVDMRYRITDPQKAMSVLRRDAKLTMVDTATGKVLAVPSLAQVGKLRQLPSAFEDTQRIYWVFFNNSEMAVKAGSSVTLFIGDLKIEGIVVD